MGWKKTKSPHFTDDCSLLAGKVIITTETQQTLDEIPRNTQLPTEAHHIKTRSFSWRSAHDGLVQVSHAVCWTCWLATVNDILYSSVGETTRQGVLWPCSAQLFSAGTARLPRVVMLWRWATGCSLLQLANLFRHLLHVAEPLARIWHSLQIS